MPRSIPVKVEVALLMVIGLCLSVSADEESKFKCPANAEYFYPCKCEGGGETGIFLRCENTNLASMAVGLSNVRLPIEELRMYRCNVKKLQGEIFQSLLLQKLVLEETPVVELDENVFVPVGQSLTHLHFLKAPLQGLPTKALAPLKKLEVLEVHGGNITQLRGGMLPGLPKLKEIRLNYCGIKSVQKNALQGLRTLTRIDFHHNELKDIPAGTFKNKRNVKLLDLSHNNFNKLESRYFQDLNQLTWCNMSNNAIKNFGRNPFARNTVMGWLSLSHNLFSEIDARSFRSMRFLRRLYLSDNQISKVGRNAFSSMRRIGTIDLARNRLKTVEAKLFEDFQYCEIIDLAENEITIIKRGAFKDLFLVAINISHNQISTLEESSFINTLNITTLDLSYNNISMIPEEAFPGKLSYMTELRLQYNNISDLSHIPFDFPGIKILNATYNRIEEIPKGTFSKLYELHTIDVSHNQIKTIGRGVFSQLFSLRQINLSHNSLETLIGSIFGSMPTLLSLDISHNRIGRIARAMFTNLVSLRELYLGNNEIDSIFLIPQSLNYLHLQNNNISYIRPGHTWPVMNALIYMNLDHNNLGDSIESGTFRNLNSLRTLSLNNNSITVPSWQAFSEMQTLQYLNLDHNQITNITRGAFGRLPVVFRLNLAYNGVSNVSKQAFDGLLQLITLNLSHNALEHIPNEAFRGCVSMQTIDLSYNFLKKVDNGTHGVFDDLLSIRNINVSHNQFGTISKKMFPYHKWIPYNLQTVDLSYNRMPVLYKNLIIGMQKVKLLNVSHNLLNEVRPNVLGNLTKLEVLDLSSNELEALANGVFARGGALREVHLQNNSLIAIPAAVLMSNQNLTYLDVSHNNLHHYYEEFVPRAINGSTIRYRDNPVECDCTLRRIRAWFDTWLESESWDDIVCTKPPHLYNRTLTHIAEGELRCNDERRAYDKYQVHPDVRFRLHGRESDELEKLEVSWYVTTRDDVGGFVVSVHNTTSGKEIRRQPFSYTARRQKYPDVPRGRYRVCVGALDSTQEIRPIQPSQCHNFMVSHASISVSSPLLLLLTVTFSFWTFTSFSSLY